jgi:hypothetical protein
MSPATMSAPIRPDSQWPKLLVGPMVRRVTMDRAHFFVATSVAAAVHVKLYDGRVKHQGSAPLAEGSAVQLDRIGKKLWLGVVGVDIPSGTAPGRVLGYDLLLSDREGEHGLFRLGLLGGTAEAVGGQWDQRRARMPLGYQDGYLPSFALPPAHPRDLRIVHASCRKPHGGGQKEGDALQMVDAAIKDAVAGSGVTAANRPQQLFLSGDQIYADDVAGGLLAALTEAGERLLGWDEQMPGLDPLLDWLIDPGWRTRFLSMKDISLKDKAPTEGTDYSANHLLRFGEWVAMYVFAWSDALWATDGDEAGKDGYDVPEPPPGVPLEKVQSLIEKAEMLGLPGLPPRVAKALELGVWLDKFRSRTYEAWMETRSQVIGYADSVRSVRRALANVATYTMFDDHEVTDDWFLNARNRERLAGSTMSQGLKAVGPRILRNGLSAYAIFQHWGNVPTDFESSGGKANQGRRLVDLWRYTSKANPGTLATTVGDREADVLLGIASKDWEIPAGGTRADFRRMRWDYAIGFPAHRLLALDTRTWRFYPTKERYSWTSLAKSIPNPDGKPLTSGGAPLRAVAQAWRDAGTAARQAALVRLGDFTDALVALALALHKPKAELVSAAVDAVRVGQDLVAKVPGRLALPAAERVDPESADGTAFRDQVRANLDALTAKQEILSQAVLALQTVVSHDFGEGAEALDRLLDALIDFVDAATHRSALGMAYAAQRAVEEADVELMHILSTVSLPEATRANAVAAIDLASSQLTKIAADIGIDKLAAKLFRDGRSRLGVGLIREDALKFQVTRPLLTTGSPGSLTLLLSPAPVFGNLAVELAQRAATLRLITLGKAGEEEMDLEAWSVNVPSMINLFEAVGAGGVYCAVVLSGDVHYAGTTVNDVKTGKVSGRYIQLTSSSLRNSDTKTRVLGRLDDLLYDDTGTVFYEQADFLSMLPAAGASSLGHLTLLARAKVDETIEAVKETPTLGEVWDSFWDNTVSLDDVLEMTKRVAMAGPNSVRSLATETAWQIGSAVTALQEFRDDPLLAVYGDFLTAGPAAREQIGGMFEALGVDKSLGLTARTVSLRDHRPNRLKLYVEVAKRIPDGTAAWVLTNEWQRRTVGHANAGFVSFNTRPSGGVTSVVHEIRWYPDDEPPEVRKGEPQPMPRRDWLGTRQVGGWFGFTADVGRLV